MRSGYEQLGKVDLSDYASDGQIMGSIDGVKNEVGPPIEKLPVDIVLTASNQSCATAGQIDGSIIHDLSATIKIRIDPRGAKIDENACLFPHVPFYLRVLNAPANIFGSCYETGDFCFASSRTTCKTSFGSLSGKPCEANPSGGAGETMTVNATNYLVICRDPAQGLAIIHFQGYTP